MNFKNEPVYVGRDFGGRSVKISPELVATYCAAVEADPADYNEVAPALLLHSECYENLDWYLRNIIGNLHARQEWELFHPVAVGQTVYTRGFIRDRYIKRGREYVVKETWTLNADGLLLTRGITHQSFPIDDPAKNAGGFAVDKSREKSAARKFEIGNTGGQRLEPLERTVTGDMCMAFSGPMKNYHNDKEEAEKLGFPDIVVQGMLPICFLSELLSQRFGAGWTAGGKMDVRLVNVLWGGESVTANAEITGETPAAGATRVAMDVWVEKADGTKVIVGNAVAVSNAS
jgi:acyl dehydratase